MPEAGINVRDGIGFLERLRSLKNIEFSAFSHKNENHLSNQECKADNCLVGYYYLPTIIPAVVLAVEVVETQNTPKVRMVSLFLAYAEYQEGSVVLSH